eukprot:1102701_1
MGSICNPPSDESDSSNDKQIKHHNAVTYGLEVVRKGFVKADHFDNIYRLKPKFEGAPNLRQVSGFQIYGTGQPNKSTIPSLIHIWFNEMNLNKCLWINMRSEPVIYVNDMALAPRDPKHPSENIDFGDISIQDLNVLNKELEKTVKTNITSNGNICTYHVDTYAPLPADRKDRIMECKCEHGADDVFGLVSLYQSFKEEDNLNITLKRITVLDEKAPEPEDIVRIVDVIANESDDKTVIVFNCMMGKGRTTEGMIIACLIKQIVSKKKDALHGEKWPNDIPQECEEIVSFDKKLKKNEANAVSDEVKRDYELSESEMKKGNFTLIKQLVKILSDEYGLDGATIKAETDDIIDRCQHIQNMRKCVYLALRRFIHEVRQNERGYWKKIAKQYLQRYYVLIVFNAYLHDVMLKQKKGLDEIDYIQWISQKEVITNTMGTLKAGALAEFNWN